MILARTARATRDVEADGELLVHDVQGGLLLVLNPVGAAVYELLDGARDEHALAAVVAEAFGLGADAVLADVRTFLEQLRAHGLAVEVGRDDGSTP